VKHASLALALLTLGFAAGAAADEEVSACAGAAVASMQARYEHVKDLSASFEQESRSVALGGPGAVTKSRGEVVFAKPGRMRWSYAAPEESLVVSDGVWMWIYDPTAGEAQKLPVGDGALSGTAIQFLLGEGEVQAAFLVRELACGEAEVRLELLPREPATYEKLHLAVDRKSGDVRETEVFDLLGNTTRVRFAQVRVNTQPDAALFRFDAPDGVDVIELP
jgi:outer membrane lipoprotein carrier protein